MKGLAAFAVAVFLLGLATIEPPRLVHCGCASETCAMPCSVCCPGVLPHGCPPRDPCCTSMRALEVGETGDVLVADGTASVWTGLLAVTMGPPAPPVTIPGITLAPLASVPAAPVCTLTRADVSVVVSHPIHVQRTDGSLVIDQWWGHYPEGQIGGKLCEHTR